MDTLLLESFSIIDHKNCAYFHISIYLLLLSTLFYFFLFFCTLRYTPIWSSENLNDSRGNFLWLTYFGQSDEKIMKSIRLLRRAVFDKTP